MAARFLKERQIWPRRSSLRSVDERPSMADRYSASPYLWTSARGQDLAARTTERVDAEVGLGAVIDRRSTARSGLLLNSFQLESSLVHGCRRQAQQLCRGRWWPRWGDGSRWRRRRRRLGGGGSQAQRSGG
ncbi:hypothetical protein NL676_003964 [Syzygium grande]|nr:hypothetical protein NL676_003964 [Syzygium grande]